jgi:excisionase family DNA binding protein
MATTETQTLLTVAETAARLRVSRLTVYRRIAKGQIPALRIGDERGPLRIPEDELSAWLYGEAA